MLLKILRCATLLSVALLAGLAFAHVLEQPAKMQYDAALSLTLQKSLYVQWGPPHIGAVLEPWTIVATGLLAFLVRKNKRDLRFSFRLLLVGCSGEFRLSHCNTDKHPVQLDRSTCKLGNGPCHSFRASVWGTRIARIIAGIRRGYRFRW